MAQYDYRYAAHAWYPSLGCEGRDGFEFFGGFSLVGLGPRDPANQYKASGSGDRGSRLPATGGQQDPEPSCPALPQAKGALASPGRYRTTTGTGDQRSNYSVGVS